jgi:crotonobetainyl-CoA:carnitine CoA-transferase CaiB-like acyl-CoA transferase
MIKLLEGVRVIESAMLLTGDHLATLLGDLGADVIKVERPPFGDYIRDFLGQIRPRYSPAHVQVNKNKRSMGLDLRQPDALEVFWRLLATADVFIDGAAGNATASLGIGYEEQRRRKPDIIYCQVSGYGAGPYAGVPTHGAMMNALAGSRPQVVEDGVCRPDPDAQADIRSTALGGEGTAMAGIWGAYMVAAALHHRARTGEGCAIDVSASDAVIASAWVGARYGLNWDRMTDTSSVPPAASQAKYAHYETSDGKLILFCGIEHKFWANFCRAAGREDLVEVTVTTGPVDFADDDQLRRTLAAVFRTRTQAEWVEMAVRHDIAMGPAYNTVAEVAADPHTGQREIFHPGVHPVAGEFTYVGQPAMVMGQPYEVHRHAPSVGEHTCEVLSEVGYTELEIERLHDQGLIGP